jgi:hypothetical protein
MDYKPGGYEAHITADKAYRLQMEVVSREQNWTFSEITGCPLLGQGTYCYLTGYSPSAQELLERLRLTVDHLQFLGVVVLRSKIEHIVYDTKTGVNELVEDTVTAVQARRLRLKIGKPLAEADRWWRLESNNGLNPNAPVPFSRIGEPTDYKELARLEDAIRNRSTEHRG